jgi:hypothetical protein
MSGIKLVDSTAEEYRRRLEKMSDERLLKEGEAAAYMSDPKIQREVRPEFVMQLRQCRAEWRRRHPKRDIGHK